MAAVKEISDKQNLSVGDGKHTPRSHDNLAFTCIYPLPAAISGSGDTLPCKHVIHVHSPQWLDKEAVPNLEKAIKNCLTLAENHNLSTVAFPSVASGS